MTRSQIDTGNGRRFWLCAEKAGGDGAVKDPPENNGELPEELLKGLKLSDAELEALKTNKGLRDAMLHSIEQKRLANKEAKEHREKLEALEADRKKLEQEGLAKKGEFEKLYNETKAEVEAKDKQIKDALIWGELNRLAGQNGLTKAEYLRLIDQSSIKVDLKTMEVTGVEETFNAFKKDNPALFGVVKVPKTDDGQPKGGGGDKNDKLEQLKILETAARKSPTAVNLARYNALRAECKKDGLIKTKI